jgi:hypothetical protein
MSALLPTNRAQPWAPELASLEVDIERVSAELVSLLRAGDRPAAERLIDELRELAWQRRAAVIRGRRHCGPGLRASDEGVL